MTSKTHFIIYADLQEIPSNPKSFHQFPAFFRQEKPQIHPIGAIYSPAPGGTQDKDSGFRNKNSKKR